METPRARSRPVAGLLRDLGAAFANCPLLLDQRDRVGMGHQWLLVGIEGMAAVDASRIDAHHQNSREAVEAHDCALDVATAIDAGHVDAARLDARLVDLDEGPPK